jgi:hypothetical protein
VATFLLLLEAFSEGRSDKKFQIVDLDLLEKVQSVLVCDGQTVYNRPNPFFQLATIKSVIFSGLGTAAAGAIGIYRVASAIAYAARATRIAEVLSWSGGPTCPAACAARLLASQAAASVPYAAVVVPAVAGAAVLIGGGCFLLLRSLWRNWTIFDDPRLHGFPETELGPLTPGERMQKEDTESSVLVKLFGEALVYGANLQKVPSIGLSPVS